MKQSIILFFVLFCFASINAQEHETGANKRGSLRINILPLGIGGEIQLAERHTLELDFHLGSAGESRSSTGNGTELLYLALVPTTRTQYRYFFNRDKRRERGRSLYNNSGMFIGGHIGFRGPDIEVINNNTISTFTNQLRIGSIWGVQRTWNNNLYLGFSTGPAIVINNRNTRFTLVGSLNFSYVIQPKKKKKNT